MRRKAIVYRSGPKRNKKGYAPAPENDRSGIAGYVEMHNLDKIDEFSGKCEPAISTDSSLSEAFAASIERKAELLLIERLSDLSNDDLVQKILIAAARHHNVEIVAIRSPQCTDEEIAPIQNAVKFLYGVEQRRLAERLRLARKSATSRSEGGSRGGRKPYGFSTDADEAVHEREILRQMKDYREQGMSCRKIAERLNKDGIKPHKKTGRWWGKTVDVILRNADERDKAKERTSAEPRK